MVASDTVVGLVGAGVLLVALVGVFVYESSAVEGGTAELTNFSGTATGSGKVDYTAATGTRPDPTRPDVCIPPSPQQPCAKAQTGFDFTVKGLPIPRGLSYVGFVPDGTSYIVIGKGSCTATDCKFVKPKSDMDKGSVTKFIVSLERGDAASPTYIITEFAIANREISGTQPINFLGETGTHALSFNSLGSDSEVSAVLRNVPNKGFVYHGWMVKVNGTSVDYRYVGAFGANNGTTYNATLRGEIAGGKADYLGFVVTLEADGKARTMPGGPEIITAYYGKVSQPTVAK